MGTFWISQQQLGHKQIRFRGHLGPTRVPQEESDPASSLSLISTISKKTRYSLGAASILRPWAGTFVMPSFILGAVPDSTMNAAYSLAIYAAVCAHLGEPLGFPGSIESW
jgi:hypothetical protein